LKPELKPESDFFIVTCEHGGNRVPSRYRQLFAGHEHLLTTHRGYDPGALRLAREMAARLNAALFVSTITRLLIDLNRSILHPRLYSEITRAASRQVQKEIRQRYYLPYRTKVETQVEQAIARGKRVIHLSCHSFTPELNDKMRDADIGFLYGTDREAEADFCRRWRAALRARAPDMKIRLNYPYAGNDDGFTTALRRRFPAERYLGIEVEVNQRHVLENARHWRDTRKRILDALSDTVAAARPQVLERREACQPAR
jgi:predicted N-formylglutamate amidohydrolase